MRQKALIFLIYSVLGLLVTVSLVAGAPATAKNASSALAITADGSLLVAVNPDSNSITVINLRHTADSTEIPVGIDPRAVAIDETRGRAYVANQGSDSLSIIDLNARAVSHTLAVGDRPVGVVASPDGRCIFVAELGADTVRGIDAETLETAEIIPVADRPRGIALTPDGAYLLVTHLLRGEVTVIPLADLNLRTTVSTWANVAPAPAVIASADGARAYLPQTMAHGQGLNTQFDNSVFPKVSVLDLENLAHVTAEHISLPETDQPVGLPWDAALARGDTELWVVNSGTNDLSVIDLSTPNRPVRAAHIIVGANPRGVVLSPDGAYAYVNNTLAGTVSVIDAQTYTVVDEIVTTGIPLPPLLLNGKRLFFSSATENLARAGWISCNTCHVEGEHDGRTWVLQFTGEVPAGENPVVVRNTTSLLGMIETYPLRWSAEWDESADSEFSVRFEQYGDGLIDGDMHPTLGAPNQGRSYDLDSLAAFIDSLQVPERHYALNAQEEQGRQIFESEATQCAVCHLAPLYTDLQVHDVGTADGAGEWFGPLIDTPTLRFLYDSAPYLHDGSAPTLYDVLVTANPADEHGVTSHLAGEEIDALIAFMLALPYNE